MRKLSVEDLLEIINEVVDIEEENLKQKSFLETVITADSHELLRIYSRIEARYGFRFNPSELPGVKTFGDILAAVNIRIAQLKPPKRGQEWPAGMFRLTRYLFNKLMMPLMAFNPAIGFRLTAKLGKLLYNPNLFGPSLDEVRSISGCRTDAQCHSIAVQIAAKTIMNSLLYHLFRRSGLEPLLPYVVCRDTEQLFSCESVKRPTIFIHFHFGPLIGLPAGLLKLGITAAILTGQNSDTPLPEELIRYHILDSTESRAQALLKAIEHLSSNGNILMAIDGGGSSYHLVELLGHRIPFMRGAATLSRLTGARLIPVVTRWIPDRGRILFQALPAITPPSGKSMNDAEFENALLTEAAHRFDETMKEAPEEFSLTQLRRFLHADRSV